MVTAADINQMNRAFWSEHEPHCVQAALAMRHMLSVKRAQEVRRNAAKSADDRRDRTRERDERIIASPLAAKQIAAAERLTVSQVYRIRKRSPS